jgi:outer membrane lipoprotein SlyB
MTVGGTLLPAVGLPNQRKVSPARLSQESTVMKIVPALLVIATFAVTAESAEAKGCLKGAAVGGVAGHYAGHHGVLGAAAGCLYGRHRAKEQEQERQQQQTQSQDLPIDHGTSGM